MSQKCQRTTLSKEAREAINLLIRQTDPVNSVKIRVKDRPGTTTSRDCRLPIPGTAIMKQYKGMAHKVLVLKDGFEYGQKRYKSLSAIAKRITGSHWNGYNFFGLEK